ncbi:MAG: hypothetical protein PUK68_11175 [Lachnospiraceae bacterium]|nr:hypothetical protein [Lachnospiraceae bacterium]
MGSLSYNNQIRRRRNYEKDFAIILSLTFLFQVIIPVPETTTVVSDSKAPDYDIWMADTLIQGLNGEESL